VLADRLDKRLLLLVVTVVALTCSAGLGLNAGLHHPLVWVLFVLGPASSATMAVSFTALRSLLPLLLEDEMRPAAFALQSTYGSFGMMVGPAAAGAVIAAFSLRATYAIDVVTYAVAFSVFVGIAPSPPVTHPDRPRGSVLEGIRFLRGSAVTSIFGIDLLAMIFGMPRALFPALAQRLGGGPALYGLLLSSVAAGAFIVSVTSGWTTRIRRQGFAVIVAVSAWGAAIAVAGLVRSAVIVLVLFAVAGAADMISGVYRSTIAAAMTPDDLRGRVSGIEFAVYAGGPVLGDVEAGVVGGLAGVPVAIVSGGLACVGAAALFGLFARRLVGYRTVSAQKR
jgi:MFS family permease